MFVKTEVFDATPSHSYPYLGNSIETIPPFLLKHLLKLPNPGSHQPSSLQLRSSDQLRSNRDQQQVETYSEPNQTSKMEFFAKIINGFQPLTIFAKRSFVDI